MTLAVSPREIPLTDNALIRERLSRVLDVAERCIPVLGVRDESHGRQAYKREKFLCETALVLYAGYRGSGDAGLRERCRELGALLAPGARDDEVIALMALRPGAIPELSVAHVCLDQIGLSDPAFDRTIARMLELGSRLPERVFWKDLEAAWLAARSDRFRPPEGLATSLAKTALAVGLDTLTAKREELYAFTHGVIYFTDFGHQQAIPPRELVLILGDAEGALVRCMDDDDFDLAAELLMTWPFFGVPLSPVAEFCLQVLMGVEEEAGFLPSLTLDLPNLGQLEPEEAKRKLLDEAYHTIYVMGLLYAALLRAGTSLSENGAPQPVASAPPILLPPRQHDGKRVAPQWEKYHAALPKPAQARLGHFVAGAALSRTLQANDLDGMRRVLLACLDAGCHHVPGLDNASEIVTRLARASADVSGAQAQSARDDGLHARGRDNEPDMEEAAS